MKKAPFSPDLGLTGQANEELLITLPSLDGRRNDPEDFGARQLPASGGQRFDHAGMDEWVLDNSSAFVGLRPSCLELRLDECHEMAARRHARPGHRQD